MEGFVFSHKIMGGRFLGSRDKVLLVGDLPDHSTQIEVVKMSNQEIGNECQQLASVCVSGDCSAMEMCGITR